jgi:hypothetical protein
LLLTMPFLLRVALALGLTAQALAAAPVGNLFQVDFSQNTAGGCQYVGQANMQLILNDCSDLAARGQQLLADYANGVPEAGRLVDAFFFTGGHLTAAQVQQVRGESRAPARVL